MESISYCNNIMERASKRKLIPPSSPNINKIVGVPKLNPRIGHEYQVEVPSMITKSEMLKLPMHHAGSKLVHDEVENYGHHNNGAVSVTVDNLKRISDNGKESRTTYSQSVMTGGQPSNTENCQMVRSTLNDSWSNADVQSFFLGLFIFGKNFVQIKRFLENKGMGEILLFYYGKFYNSDEYRRWSVCKKMKGRKCITGHKLFSGRKQRELLSRLVLHVSEELKDVLQQVSKSYSEGRISLEEYISSLKSTVGLGALVEAVGIGKGKEDLTDPAVEHGKKTPVFPIPTSKTWSALGPSDIIKHLAGGNRLSKAKSNDLFREAIWPRLLARGWHLENLENQGSKNFVVFLIPGIEKFSRSKLVKGDHYFDSVSDVLSKVISEPNLLKLEDDETNVGSCNKEEAKNKSKEDVQPHNYHNCFLKHQASTNNSDHMKGTVFYTSSDFRELKTLPGKSVGKVEVDADDMEYNEGNKHTSKTSHRKGKLGAISTSGTEAAIIYSKNSSTDCKKAKHNRDATGQKEVNVKPDNNDTNKIAEKRKNQKTVSNGNQLKITIMSQSSQKARSGHSDLAVPPIKRQRLTACAKAETSRVLENFSGGLGSVKLTVCPKAETSNILENSSGGLGSEKWGLNHQQGVTLISSSAEGSLELKNEGRVFDGVCPEKGICCDKVEICESQDSNSISFSAHQVPLKSEDSEMMATAEEDGQGLNPNDIIPRRKSTRNRPLTVRALESLASEFLHAQKKQKRKGTLTLKDPFSTCCRRARTKVQLTGTPDSIEEQNLNEDSSVIDSISKPLDYIKS
ncbi:hypothetical protein Fmac_024581 [Flemingia macrophylla]|uniref:SANT domain-containing protein n=1 Tax=Flemingia macrophylla TaxID=520843 RepID=A0ABD1LPW6_9FABA